jgi:predicted RNA-binding protein with PIN domain
MNIIIDGYNVLKLALKKDFVSDSERTMFVRRLATYARRKRHEITIVFDGGRSARPYTEKDHGVTIVYSGDYMSADDYIGDCANSERGSELLVVTSDNALRTAACRCGLDVLASDDFYRLVMYELGKDSGSEVDSGVLHKVPDVENEGDVAALMEEASHNMVYKEGDIPQEYVQLVRSKITKRLAKKIKAL